MGFASILDHTTTFATQRLWNPTLAQTPREDEVPGVQLQECFRQPADEDVPYCPPWLPR